MRRQLRQPSKIAGQDCQNKGDSDMKRRLLTAVLPFFLACTLLLGGSAFAEDAKSRMKARKPTIDLLKSKGVVGENNRGYLEFLGANKEREDVVKAENADRRRAYAGIAKKENTTIKVVESNMAVFFAGKAKPGQWLQDKAGKWYKK